MAGAVAAGAPPGHASRRALTQPVRYRLTALAGSPHHLVYTKFATTNRGRKLAKTGGLFVMSRSGERTRIDTVPRDTYASLDRSMLRYGLNWRNLRTGASGLVPWPGNNEGDALGPALPDGWIVLHRSSPTPPYAEEIYDQAATGETRALGVPYPNNETINMNSFGLSSGGSSVVTSIYDEDTADTKVVTVNINHPDQFRTLVPSLPGGSICNSVTARYTACLVMTFTPSSATITTIELIGLGHKHRARTTDHCALSGGEFGSAAAPAVLRHSAAWITLKTGNCRQGRLKVLGLDGKVRTSTRRFAPDQLPVSAFGEVVVATRSRHTLEAISNAHAQPKVLIHVD
jgi:hypothetical protein